MHKIVTMSDSAYFMAGKLFLETRDKLKADIVLYGPDLTKKQISILSDHNINYVKVDPIKFRNKMQYLKFEFLYEEIYLDLSFNRYSGFTFMDWDTFIINDWEHIFEKYDFDFGITVRNDMVKKRVLRAYTNGGTMFASRSAIELINFAKKTILKGRSSELKEYDEIWNTLEIGRPKHRTHSRKNLRWWTDQAILSALCLKYFKENGYSKITGLKPTIFKFKNFKIGLFDCNYYNVIESLPIITNEKNIFIRHLKDVGRNILGLEKTREKL